MAETQRKLDQDFGEGAVRLMQQTGKPTPHVAQEPGILNGTSSNQVKLDRYRSRTEAQHPAPAREQRPRSPAVFTTARRRQCTDWHVIGWRTVHVYTATARSE